MDFVLSYNNNEEQMWFPVIPNTGISLSYKQNNIVFSGIEAQIQAIGTPGLYAFELSSFFPRRNYTFIRPKARPSPDTFYSAWDYVAMIERGLKRRIPFRAIYYDNSDEMVFNFPVTIDRFEYGYNKAGDLAYSISFTEYRFANTEETALGVQNQGTVQNAGVNGTSTVQTAAQAAESIAQGYTKLYTDNDAVLIAKTMYNEARGIQSKTEIACIGWTILNRVDSQEFQKTISAVVTAANQFAYSSSAKTVSDYGYNLVDLATDILDRWSREHAGETSVGRVLPKEFYYFSGDGSHNYFRDKFRGGTRWDYSLPSPYAN